MPETPPLDDEWFFGDQFVDAAFFDGDDLVVPIEVSQSLDAAVETYAVEDEELYADAVSGLLEADAAFAASAARRLRAIDVLRLAGLDADRSRAAAIDVKRRAEADRDGAGRPSALGEYGVERPSLRATVGGEMPTAVRSREISERSVRAEIGVALGMSEGGAGAVIDTAELLRRRYPVVFAALSEGAIRERHATRLVHAVAVLPAAAAELVIVAALAEAGRAFSTFGALVDRLVERAHPRPADERHAEAMQDRAVWLTEHPDQMAELHVLGPATEIHAAFHRIRSMAKAVKRGEDDAEGGVGTRTLDQITADVAVDLLLDGEAEATPDAARGIRPTVFVTVPALTMATGDTDFGAAEVDGVGPIDLETATRLIGAASEWTRIITHPVSGMVLSVDRERYRPPAAIARIARWAYRMCVFPGCRMPAHRCELDHLRDWNDGGETSLGNLAPECTGHHTVKHATKWAVTPSPGGGVTVTSPGGQVVSTPTRAPWRLPSKPMVDMFAAAEDAPPF